MTDSSAVPATTDRVAGVLAAHRLLNKFEREGLSVAVHHVCSCGEWSHTSGRNDWPELHRAHVAAVLADLFGDAQADAWEAGRRVERDAWFGRATNENLRNPYRRGTDDGEDT